MRSFAASHSSMVDIRTAMLPSSRASTTFCSNSEFARGGAPPALTRLMSSLLSGVGSADPVTYGAMSLGLLATAAPASYLPARRAVGVNPVE
jgi:hypothetical protein